MEYFVTTFNDGKDIDELLAEIKKDFLYLDPLECAKDETRGVLKIAAKKAMESGALPQADLPDFVVEEPAEATHGDLSSNLAMVSARTFGMPPRKIAEILVENMPDFIDSLFCKVELAGPGFLNFFFSEGRDLSVLMNAILSAENYGKTNVGKGEKINVEFVSANPTGPMHLGNARGGALGDCLAETLRWSGYDVTKEFYINDAGNQIVKFGKSLAARYMQIINGVDSVEFPEDGYQGEDITQLAREFYEMHGDEYAAVSEAEREKALVDYALPKNIQGLKDDLAKYRIQYDYWAHESDYYASGAVQAVIDELKERNMAYEKDGALWYKATEFGSEKDEVIVRANGIPTYFAADIAYHKDKFMRGATRAINVWGADHHGHVQRMKDAMDAIGLDGSKLDIVIMQFVQLVQDGKPVKMSKRTGKAITLSDLLDEVPIDSARFFFNLREPGSRIEFDLDLAIRTDSENPVYYVQYAHARICSILRNLEEMGVTFSLEKIFVEETLLKDPTEKALIRRIAAFPSEIVGAAESYDPARITRYVQEVAALFHRFYNACNIKDAEPDLQQARLALCVATKTVLENGLSILKVTAPEKM